MSKKGTIDKKEEISNLYKDLAALRPTEDFEPVQDDYDKAVKICNKILNLDPADATAFHCKIVALIQAGKVQDCLKQVANSKFELSLQFEVAYCHYRNNDLHKALEVLDTVTSPGLKHNELRAQVLYKLEQFEKCFSVYRDIIRSSDDSYDKERATNMSAVTAQLGDSARTMDTRESYEQTYNTGCNYASVGDWAAAEEALASAEKAAREYWEDEEDEVEEEVGIIKVQQGYVMQRQGRDKEAQTIYNQVLRNKPSDIGLTAVASNNLIAINKDQNIFDSKKRIKAATVEGLETKLNSTQRSAIARNNALLAMFTAQVDLCKQLLSALDTEDKDLIMAGVLTKAGKHQEAVSCLDTSDPIKLLTAAHLLLAAGDQDQAVKLLAKLPDAWKYRVGVLSSLVCLYLGRDNRDAVAGLLKDAVEWNKKRPSGAEAGDDGMATVWRKTAEFHLKTGEAKVAAQSLEELYKLEPGMTTLAQLVLAYSKFDLAKALEISRKLPPFKASDSVDIESLDTGSWAMGSRTKAGKKTPKSGAEKTPKTGGDDKSDLAVKKKRSKKKKRLPKNYNPNADPDPERWLPRRERTGLKYMPGYRKPRKDKRKAEKFTGAQGTDQGKSETYDYSNRVTGAKEAAAKQTSPAPEPAPGPRQQKGPGRTQQKKKKGGKNKF